MRLSRIALFAFAFLSALSFASDSPFFQGPPVVNALGSPSGALTPNPLNANFTAGSQVAAAPPNYNFEESPDLTGWTVENGSATNPSGGQSGKYIDLAGGASATSQPFSVSTAGNSWTYYRIGGSFAFYVLSGADYTTETQLDFDAASAGSWQQRVVNLSPYSGQNIKVKYRTFGTTGFDEGAWRNEVPNWTPGSGDTPLWKAAYTMPAATASLGNYSNSETACSGAANPARTTPAAFLKQNDDITSQPFTIPSDAERMMLWLAGEGTPSVDVILTTASDNPPYSIPHPIFVKASFGGGTAIYTACDVSTWAGQTVKLKFASSSAGSVIVPQGGDSLSFEASLNQMRHGDPVSMATGAQIHMHTDISIPGRGLPLVFSRSYVSSGSAIQSSLGWGWSHNYEARLTIFDDGSVLVHSPGGAKAFYENVSGRSSRQKASTTAWSRTATTRTHSRPRRRSDSTSQPTANSLQSVTASTTPQRLPTRPVS